VLGRTLIHCCAWPAEGHSDCHDQHTSWAGPTVMPVCLICWTYGMFSRSCFQSAVGGVPTENNSWLWTLRVNCRDEYCQILFLLQHMPINWAWDRHQSVVVIYPSDLSTSWFVGLCRRPLQLTTNMRRSWSSRSVYTRATLPTCWMCPGQR